MRCTAEAIIQAAKAIASNRVGQRTDWVGWVIFLIELLIQHDPEFVNDLKTIKACIDTRIETDQW